MKLTPCLLAVTLMTSNHFRRRSPATARRRQEAARRQGALRRRAQRRVLLAARRHAQEPGDARVPQRRERVHRRRHGAAEAAAGKAVRGDRRPHQAGRQLGAVPRARLLVLLALRDRQGLSGLRAPQGRDGRGRGSAARRQRDGGRQGLLQRRRLGSQPGQQPARVGRGRRRPPPVHDQDQEPRHRRALFG